MTEKDLLIEKIRQLRGSVLGLFVHLAVLRKRIGNLDYEVRELLKELERKKVE